MGGRYWGVVQGGVSKGRERARDRACGHRASVVIVATGGGGGAGGGAGLSGEIRWSCVVVQWRRHTVCRA